MVLLLLIFRVIKLRFMIPLKVFQILNKFSQRLLIFNREYMCIYNYEHILIFGNNKLNSLFVNRHPSQ